MAYSYKKSRARSLTIGTSRMEKAKGKEPTFEEVFTKAGLVPELIERGRVQGLKIAARNAMAKGLPINMIHDITGLSINKIKKLK